MAKLHSYAVKHPRLHVVAVVTAPNALDAMRLLMKRDETWGDMGIDEAVYLGKGGSKESYSLFGQEDCGTVATIQDVIAEIAHRQKRRLPDALNRFQGILRAALKPHTQEGK